MTAATPVAAALMVAGVSPGAALVFLLAGPATNLVTISAVKSTLGRGSALVYVVTIGLASYGFGTLLDLFWVDLAGSTPSAHLDHDHLTSLHWISAIILGALMLWHIVRKLRNRFRTAR